MVTPFENGLAKRGTRFVDIAEMFHNKKWEVHYYTSNFSHAYKRYFSLKEIEEEKAKRQYSINFIPIIGYKKNISVKRILSNLIMSYRFYKELSKDVNDYDCIMIPSRPVDFIFFISLIKRKKSKAKFILDIRDVWPDAFGNKSHLFKIYCNYFLKRSLDKYDLFFHISPSFVKWLNRYNKTATSIFVPPGYSINRFNKAKLKLKDDLKINLVFIGALQYQLDILQVIKAVGNNERYSLTIIGENGKGQRYQECNDFIKRNKLNNVEILGVIPPEEVCEALTQFDIGIIPMISNSITNKFFDYIASYLPILVLGDNDSSTLVSKLNIGWKADFDYEDIIQVLNNISKEEINIKIKNIDKVRKEYDRNYLYKTIVDNISHFYQNN